MSKQIDILCINSIKAINGPVILHRLALRNLSVFTNRGYKLSILFKEGFYEEAYYHSNRTTEINRLKNILKTVKKYLIRVYKKFDLLNILSLYYFDYVLKKRIIRYINLKRCSDIIVTDSEREMYHYLKNRNNKHAKTVMFLHTDGIILKMFALNNPSLTQTYFYELMRKRFEFTINEVDSIVFICNTAKTNFLKAFPNYPDSKLKVVLNGVEDLPKIKTKDTSFKHSFSLTCVGSISYRKGQDIIVDAVKKLTKQERSRVQINLVGDGPERLTIQKQIEKYQLSDSISWLGSMDNSEIRTILSNSDIFILTSRNEGLPISIIEAMREGLPILSTSISGIPELVKNNHNGILISPNADELTNVLRNLTTYDWIHMGINSRKVFEAKFKITRVFKEYCDIYDYLLKK